MPWRISMPDGMTVVLYNPAPITLKHPRTGELIHHPKEIFTKWPLREQMKWGIIQFEDLSRKDETEFYRVAEKETVVGDFLSEQIVTKSKEPKMKIQELADYKLQQLRWLARSLLNRFDWMWIREMRGRAEVPQEIKDFYASVDVYVDQMKTAIKLLSDQNKYDTLAEISFDLPEYLE